MSAFRDPVRESLGSVVTYSRDLFIRFGDCDPAGIVFYPKYLEMFNEMVEDWCRDELNFSFYEIVARRGWGLPTVHLEVDFLAPSHFGETLNAVLILRNVGKTSIGADIMLRGPDKAVRVKGKVVLVLIDRRTNRAIELPEEVRARLASLKPVKDSAAHLESTEI
jgi:4-hydroxybenzoyl-CoA thioesterase